MRNVVSSFRRYRMVLRSMLEPPRPCGIHFLLYHKVSGDLPRGIDLGFPLFRRQMEFLHRTGRVIGYEEALQLLRAGAPLPHDRFVLTFDDGYEDFYSHAFPVLRDLSLPAIVFITTAFIEHGVPCVLSAPPSRPVRPLSWEMLAASHESGLITLGAHTHTHAELPGISEDQAIAELTGPRDLVQDRLGITLRHFAYPRARWNERVEALVKGVYDSAVVAGWSKAVADGFDPYRIPRVPILRGDRWIFFVAKTRGWLRKEGDLYGGGPRSPSCRSRAIGQAQ